MRKLSLLLVIVSLLFLKTSRADDGMWIPILLEKYNIEDMKDRGLRLSAEDIYSVNKSSLKDAIVQFGGGCTGELISDKGLLITNHHCGYRQIQQHSSVEHDYLTDGFWAMNQSDELPNEGLTVSFLVMMQDVTSMVLEGTSDSDSEQDRQKNIQKQIKAIQKTISDSSHYETEIKPFYYGNDYYLFVYEVFKDVRLVGAPPSSIGKFGGDTDNWMWPRHTGDFSMFRIYADKDNKPAEYSADNVPYVPKKSLSINLKGVKENDFTMVYGYPGRTEEYLTSDAVRFIVEKRNPARIKLRDKKLSIMREEMMKDDKVRIQLSSKYAGVANGWKKWIGEKRGLEKLDAVTVKENLEANIQKWMALEEDRNQMYSSVLSDYKTMYKESENHSLAQEYVFEAIFGVELVGFVSKFRTLIGKEGEELEKQKTALKASAKKFFKDYDAATDQKVMAALFKIYYQDQLEEYQPDFFRLVEKKYKGSFEDFAAAVYGKSIFVDEAKTMAFIDKFSEKKYKKDMAYQVYQSALSFYLAKVSPVINLATANKPVLDRKYMKALLEYTQDSVLFPDANFTLRIAYGKVEGYEPKDGVVYSYYTTLEGIIEKERMGMYDYVVDDKLKKLHAAKDYGRYAEGETMHVCFAGSNHTTGGNSGSPVLNADGHLIGVNFDRNWEGTMSDIMYDPSQCRNIALDIRYALFIVDKFAGAGYLLDEMHIIE
jgi:hypothetical protein